MSLTNDLSKLASVANTINTVGSNGQILTSNGTSSYWANAASSGAATGTITIAPNINTLINATTGNGTVATVTFYGNFSMPVGSTVVISNNTPTSYNGSWTVTASSNGATTSTVSFTSTANGSMTVAGKIYNGPAGYLVCDGSVYTRSAYPNLSSLIGTPIVMTNTTIVNTFSYSPYFNNIYASNGSIVAMVYGTASSYYINNTGTPYANAMGYTTNGTTFTSGVSAWSPGGDGAYNGSIYVLQGAFDGCGATGQSGIMYASSLAGPFTRVVLSSTSYTGTADVAYGGTSNVFVTRGGTGSSNTNFLFSSTNATTWTSCNLQGTLTSLTLASVAAYSGGIVITVNSSQGKKVFYSASGAGAYTDITSNFSLTNVTYAPTVSYQNNQFIMICSDAANGNWLVYTSSTGAGGSWTLLSRNTAWADGKFGALLKAFWNGSVYTFGTYYSPDLINWGYNIIFSTAEPAGVINNKFLNQQYGVIRTWDTNSYTASTQFPVPKLTGGNDQSVMGGASPQGYFIKT